MKKVALLFLGAVMLPSLVLAALAFRSLRDQQFLLERQRALLYQGVADAIAKDILQALASDEQEFSTQVAAMLHDHQPLDLAASFDERLAQHWPLAEVGFAVRDTGDVLSPSPLGKPAARRFYANNIRFLGNRETVAAYLNQKLLAAVPDSKEKNASAPDASLRKRSVSPQRQPGAEPGTAEDSKVTVAEGEFRQLIGQASEGTLARFVDNRLSLMFWCRPTTAPGIIFGTQVSLARLVESLGQLVRVPSGLRADICAAVLDDAARPVARSGPFYPANWKRPFVATELGEALPHWELGIYLRNPAALAGSAQMLKLTLGWLIALLLVAIAIGGWLLVADLRRQMMLARQKTDFVSNVSHELKTPLTSIRMFSEMLAEGPPLEPARQRAYLEVISTEAQRLTRLINNVLDFARGERGGNQYRLETCDFTALVRETVEAFRPGLETRGFQFHCELPATPLDLQGDRDALAQVLVNLLSNAEKYSDQRQEITVTLRPAGGSTGVELQVLDRGLGVPPGCEERIFEQFFRAHDSLNSGIPGTGLGLTLARQAARAHGGDLLYQPREGGGSCFILRLWCRAS